MKYLLIAVTSIALFVSYQQCAVSSDGGVGDLSSSGDGPPGTLPTLQLDMATMNLAATATTFNVTGACSVAPYTVYNFDTSFQETGAASSSTYAYPATCNSGRFSYAIQITQLNIRPNFPGVLTVRIKATRTSGNVEGPSDSLSIAWGGTTSPSPTPTPGPTPTPTPGPGPTPTPTPTPTPCSPSCDSGRACGSTIDSCGGNTCAPQTASPPCPPPPGSGCQTLQQNIICVSCGNYGQTITANAEECRVHCGSRSKCCEWDSNNGACTYYLHNVPADCRVESAAYPNIFSGMCY